MTRVMDNGELHDQIYSMNADSSNQRQVTTGANTHWAKLSPDGMKIAYQGYVDHNYEIFVVNTDGTGLRRLTNNPGYDQAPQWSPDGTKILYMSDKGHDREHYDIFTIKPDGTAETRLTNDARHDQVPMWSPDGKKITFESVRSNQRQIVVVNPDGTGQVQLTSATTASTDPTWSRDSTKISYRNSPSPNDNDEVWVMNADGTGKTPRRCALAMAWGTGNAARPGVRAPLLRAPRERPSPTRSERS